MIKLKHKLWKYNKYQILKISQGGSCIGHEQARMSRPKEDVFASPLPLTAISSNKFDYIR